MAAIQWNYPGKIGKAGKEISAHKMKHGFVKVAAVTPKIKVADPAHNAGEI